VERRFSAASQVSDSVASAAEVLKLNAAASSNLGDVITMPNARGCPAPPLEQSREKALHLAEDSFMGIGRWFCHRQQRCAAAGARHG
jgi:hypothetical protein